MASPTASPAYKLTSAMLRDDPTELLDRLRVLSLPTSEIPVGEHLAKHVEKVLAAVSAKPEKCLEVHASFLPPRLVAAYLEGTLVPFFGSGISIPAGVPSWSGLLDKLGLAADYLADPYVEHDALTQAELIAHAVGADVLQRQVQELMTSVTTPTLAHHLLAEMCLPVYITTNYDDLFEVAWHARWKTKPIVITNDADIATHRLDHDTVFPLRGATKKRTTTLVKLHGDAQGTAPHLILSRSDYRRHYRANTKLFELIKELMRTGVVMFLGFSHRDPEVSRLVDDMVYRFETRYYTSAPRPLFSIQFDMRQRTPEVFAARGIVALRPPAILGTLPPDATRSASIATELAELVISSSHSAHSQIDLEPTLRTAVSAIEQDVSAALDLLESYKGQVTAALSRPSKLESVLAEIQGALLTRAGQGVYVARSNGGVAGFALPDGLSRTARAAKSFVKRTYFRQARMFRHAFASDVDASVFNGQATVFFCMPLGDEATFEGLLFSAAQPGAWMTPVTQRNLCGPADFILVDSNGVVLVPPLREVGPLEPKYAPAGESTGVNDGFAYLRIHELSRRDTHVAHVVQNVVPMGFDDDIHDVAADFRLYSMVANIERTRWKLAISKAVPAAVPKVLPPI